MTQVVTIREDTGRRRVQTLNEEPSKTVQSDRNQAEMRSILAKYEGVGIIDHMREVDLEFRDVSEFEDFADLMRQTKVAEAEFMRLPSKLREVFGHDVEEWLDVAHSPERLEELRPQLEKLGVWKEPEAPGPQQVEVVHRDPDTGEIIKAPPPSDSSSSEGDGA